ncbi:MAG: hypothetical protein ACRDXX_12280 [Stackebrandtia sp.]
MRRTTLSPVVLATSLLLVGTVAATSAHADAEWTETPVDVPADADFYKVLAAGERDVWAAGTGADGSLMARWDGAKWNQVEVPVLGRLTGIDGSSDNLWVSADLGVLHWDGKTWTDWDAGQSDEANLLGVAAGEDGEAWAVGQRYVADGVIAGQIKRWDGDAWTDAKTDVTAEQWSMAAADVVAADDAWAVGTQSAGEGLQGLALHWDGEQWTTTPLPTTQDEELDLSDVVALSEDDVWALGAGYDDDSTWTVVLHWDGKEWSRVETPADCAEPVDLAKTENGFIVTGYEECTDEPKPFMMESVDGKWQTVTPPGGPGAILFGADTTPDGTTWTVGSQHVDGGDEYTPFAAYRG